MQNKTKHRVQFHAYDSSSRLTRHVQLGPLILAVARAHAPNYGLSKLPESFEKDKVGLLQTQTGTYRNSSLGASQNRNM